MKDVSVKLCIIVFEPHNPNKIVISVTMKIHSAILEMQDLSSTLKIVSLVAQVSAGSSVVNSVNMVNPVLKKKRQMGKEDVINK